MDRCAQKDQLLRDFRFFIFHKVAIDVVGFPPSFLARMFSAFRLMFIGFRVTSNVPVISFAALVLLSLPASAGPPFITDDPQPVEYQHYELYFFSLGTHAAGEITGVAPSCDCNYGGFPNVQLHFQPALAVARSNGFPLQWGLGDTEFGVKYRFIEQDTASWVPSIAIYPLLEAPTGDPARGLGTGRNHAFVPMGPEGFWRLDNVRGRRLLDQPRPSQ
jgi:hypothetical protein